VNVSSVEEIVDHHRSLNDPFARVFCRI